MKESRALILDVVLVARGGRTYRHRRETNILARRQMPPGATGGTIQIAANGEASAVGHTLYSDHGRAREIPWPMHECRHFGTSSAPARAISASCGQYDLRTDQKTGPH